MKPMDNSNGDPGTIELFNTIFSYLRDVSKREPSWPVIQALQLAIQLLLKDLGLYYDKGEVSLDH